MPTRRFCRNADRIEHKDFAFSRELLKKAADLGLTSVDIPEEYGGAEMDKVSSAIIADRIAKQGSFCCDLQRARRHRHAADHLVRTAEQKAKYLPQAGQWRVGGRLRAQSRAARAADAMNARTKAVSQR